MNAKTYLKNKYQTVYNNISKIYINCFPKTKIIRFFQESQLISKPEK